MTWSLTNIFTHITRYLFGSSQYIYIYSHCVRLSYSSFHAGDQTKLQDEHYYLAELIYQDPLAFQPSTAWFSYKNALYYTRHGPCKDVLRHAYDYLSNYRPTLSNPWTIQFARLEKQSRSHIAPEVQLSYVHYLHVLSNYLRLDLLLCLFSTIKLLMGAM